MTITDIPAPVAAPVEQQPWPDLLAPLPVLMPTMFRLDPRVKARWLEALRSGVFPHAKAALQVENVGYCCLGVANVVFELGVPGDVVQANPFHSSSGAFFLPFEVQAHLAALNDHETTHDFSPTIAWIEEHL